jgi:hypothetical protein
MFSISYILWANSPNSLPLSPTLLGRIKKDDSQKVTCLNKSNMRRAPARVTDIHA